jgi:protein SFI1
VARIVTWAKDARFYFLTTKSIKQWHAAALESSKKRRQVAYATVRRKIKMNLAFKFLSIWRSRARILAGWNSQATNLHQTKLFKKGTELFDRWNHEAARRTQNLRDSDIYNNRQLVYNHLTRWATSFGILRAQSAKATQFSEIHLSELAISQFRKLSLRIFQIEARLETADALSERNLRKHLRSMFRHWLEKARLMRNSKPISGSAITGTESDTPQVEEDGVEWPSFDPVLGLSELVPPADLTTQTPMPTPGYLNTPSKRATRARALAQISMTPATPLRTPFPSRLMTQTSAQSRPTLSRTNTNSKNIPGSNVRFVDDLEPESPTEGRSTNRMI